MRTSRPSAPRSLGPRVPSWLERSSREILRRNLSAGPDGTFGNRFDDPDATYRVLSASSQRLGCFLETLARFRIDPKLAAELADIEGEDDHFPLGEVPVEWLQKRILGVATAGGE